MDGNESLATAFKVTQMVARARRLEDACELALDAISTVVPADRAAVLLADEAGALRFFVHRGLSEAYRGVVDGHAAPWAPGERDPQPIVVADASAESWLPPRIQQAVQREGIRALTFVPLMEDDRLLGKFMVYFSRPYTLSSTETTLIRMIAAQVGFAITRLRAEKRALDAREELDAILGSMPDGLIVHDADGHVRFVNEAMLRVTPTPRDDLTRLTADEVVTRYDLYDDEERLVAYEEFPQARARRGIASVRTMGFRARGSREPIRWVRLNARPVELAGGHRIAVTVAHEVTAARRDAVARQFLLEAGGILASSLDYEATLATVARLAVPRLADWCSVQVVGDDGVARTLAVEHVDPARVAFVLDVANRYPEDPDASTGAPNVRRTGVPEIYNDIPDELLVAAARDEQHLRLLRELGLAAVMIVPMRARGRVVGVLSFASSESGIRFTDDDLLVATKLADRAAMAIDNARLYQDATRSRQRLAEERERLAVTLSSIGDAVIATDRTGVVTLLNPVASALTGWPVEEAVGRPLAEVFPIFSEKTGLAVPNPVEKVLHTGRIVGLANHTALEARDGSRRAIADSAAPIRAQDGTIVGVVLVFRDVTQEQRLERELAKASKLESIGVLAGGIAHDFNNILTSISANVSLADRRLGAESPAKGRLAAAQVACERARDLTRQLLTFSRGGAPIRSATSVQGTLFEACGFALQGSSVRAHHDVPDDIWPIDADAGQIGQVIHNIALNAAQAMPTGGNLCLTAANVVVDDSSWLPLSPGRYVRVTLTDDGPGIPPENLSRIFDPFFTTKATGSGLGLSTAYSVVKRHDGHLGVESTLGAGTSFSVYLPAAEDTPQRAPTLEPAAPGRGRVLVMDDDAAIRDLARECLEELGYECESAADGAEAIERYAAAHAAGRPFDVLMLDLTVPGGLGGRETLRRLEERYPGVRAIVSSGYSNDPVMASFRDHGFVGVLQKPFVVDDLGRMLSEILSTTRARR